MTGQVLPNDILREVSAQWTGHRLHYTCRMLYASWNPDNYVVALEERGITISRIPNGAYHGKCTATKHGITETIECVRG